jgi:crotonobetainyl-CoA:carnitine CoA-transferase CaiB-like acyl-CoA transferase
MEESRMHSETDAGPLTGLRVVEITGRGPGPFAGMLLAASTPTRC